MLFLEWHDVFSPILARQLLRLGDLSRGHAFGDIFLPFLLRTLPPAAEMLDQAYART